MQCGLLIFHNPTITPFPATGQAHDASREVRGLSLAKCSDVSIHVLAMADDGNIHDQVPVVYFVNYPVVANSDSPEPVFSLEFEEPRWPWIDGEGFDAVQNTLRDLRS